MTKMNYVKRRKEEDKEPFFVSDKFITKILRDKNNKDYVLFLLKNVLERAKLPIVEDYELVDIKIAKKSELIDSEADVVLENDKVLINIEVNQSKSNSLRTDNKSLSYICWLILRQLPTGSSRNYDSVKSVIQINLNTYDQFGLGEFVYTSKLMETTYRLVRNNSLIIIDITLDILPNMDYNTIKDTKDTLIKGLYLWICNEKEKLDELYEGDEMMKRVLGQLYDFAENGDEYLFYNKKEFEESLRYDEGLKEGREEGIKEGYENGREEEKKEIIKNLLKMNLPIDDIVTATDYSKEKILEIRNSLN